MAIEHRDLTGDQLHEPKGADAAADGTAYIADGTGSGEWVDPTATVYNKNVYSLTSLMTDVGTAGSVYFHVPVKSRILAYSVLIYGAISADTLFSPFVNGVAIADTETVEAAGTAAGQVTVHSVVSASSMAANSIVRIDTDGAAASTVRADIQLILEAIP
jgi:hypothetical protein